MTITCPDGHALRGTYEVIHGVALASPTRNPDGSIEPNHEGYTEVDWDSEETETDPGNDEPLWECVRGDLCVVSALIDTPDDEVIE